MHSRNFSFMARRKICSDGKARARQSCQNPTAKGRVSGAFRVYRHGRFRPQAFGRCAKRRLGPRQPVRPRQWSRPPVGARSPAPRRLSFRKPHHGVSDARAHAGNGARPYNERNLAEYQGRMEIDAKLLADLLRSTKALETEVVKLSPPAED